MSFRNTKTPLKPTTTTKWQVPMRQHQGIGVAFYPSKDVLAAVTQTKTMWEGEELHVDETAKS